MWLYSSQTRPTVGVDDREHLLDVVEEEAVEERLVPVLKSREEEVALHLVGAATEVLVDARALLVFGGDSRRQQAVQLQLAALLGGEARPLVEERVFDQGFAPFATSQ